MWSGMCSRFGSDVARRVRFEFRPASGAAEQHFVTLVQEAVRRVGLHGHPADRILWGAGRRRGMLMSLVVIV